GMVARALKTALPQLHGSDTRAVGVFPFRVSSGVRGYVRVSLPRPLFEGIEVAFLRFVASLAGVLLSVTSTSSVGEAATPHPPPSAATNSDARRYVAMAVHDLRNPLNVISGYGGLLADGTLGILSAEQHEAVDAINRQLVALLGLIDRLTDFERLARAETTLSVSRFVVRDLFEEIRDRCFSAPTRSVDWPGAEANFDFATDRRRLYAIVQNLVDNAIKHTEQGSISVTCSRRDGRLLVAVTDLGSGLPAGLAGALTDRHACERLQERGLGIGLYTVARYVGALGGRLAIRSPNDIGTEIEVDLPALVPPTDVGTATRG
ncbi:MAG: HAMP domain-containing histidine kinase, partial [Myxococcales bacterium]